MSVGFTVFLLYGVKRLKLLSIIINIIVIVHSHDQEKITELAERKKGQNQKWAVSEQNTLLITIRQLPASLDNFHCNCYFVYDRLFVARFGFCYISFKPFICCWFWFVLY